VQALQQWGECRKGQLLKIIGGAEHKNTHNSDETGLFYKLPPNKTLSLKGDPCNGWKNSAEKITVLLVCDANGTDKLPPSVGGKSENPYALRMSESCPVANRKTWVTQAIFTIFIGLDH
jgi:hypothetical protein